MRQIENLLRYFHPALVFHWVNYIRDRETRLSLSRSARCVTCATCRSKSSPITDGGGGAATASRRARIITVPCARRTQTPQLDETMRNFQSKQTETNKNQHCIHTSDAILYSTKDNNYSLQCAL